jgi:hypothetical protein
VIPVQTEGSAYLRSFLSYTGYVKVNFASPLQEQATLVKLTCEQHVFVHIQYFTIAKSQLFMPMDRVCSTL